MPSDTCHAFTLPVLCQPECEKRACPDLADGIELPVMRTVRPEDKADARMARHRRGRLHESPSHPAMPSLDTPPPRQYVRIWRNW
jgi:hypothetical protein